MRRPNNQALVGDAAMEPAPEGGRNPVRSCRSPCVVKTPQWSPPRKAGGTAAAPTSRKRPQWSPPRKAGGTEAGGSGAVYVLDAAMEPASEGGRNRQCQSAAPPNLGYAAMEPASEGGWNRGLTSPVPQRNARRNGARLGRREEPVRIGVVDLVLYAAMEPASEGGRNLPAPERLAEHVGDAAMEPASEGGRNSRRPWWCCGRLGCRNGARLGRREEPCRESLGRPCS